MDMTCGIRLKSNGLIEDSTETLTTHQNVVTHIDPNKYNELLSLLSRNDYLNDLITI